ncbi:hypothetical protein [Aeromonas caviae]|jgi:hypothetical protein|uniref:hypothetical protein n=1 Tax=Aeromonas TaxID=642 RepID=UPI0025B730AB|nr:hypothetical protein [Aeromonas caviae]
MSNKIKIGLIASVFVFGVSGCSAFKVYNDFRNPEGLGEYYKDDATKSFAWNVGAYAGYPWVLNDGRYDKSMDLLVNSTSYAMNLSADLGSSLAGGALGLGAGFIGGLTEGYPLKPSLVWTAQLEDNEEYNQARAIERFIIKNFKVRAVEADDTPKIKLRLGMIDINKITCVENHPYQYTHECELPGVSHSTIFVTAARPATGEEFGKILNLKPGRYGVFVTRNQSDLIEKDDAADVYFYMKDGAYQSGNNVLPLVGPREDGKRLVVIDGKTTLI